MRKLSLFITIVFLSLVSCKDDRFKDIPMEKPYWDIEDYENVTNDILFQTKDDEKLPNLQDNPAIFNKIINKENISAILDDEKLGLSFRKEFAEKIFHISHQLEDGYSVLDRQDKFIYPLELVKLTDWEYFIQVKYFKRGNEEIVKKSINPDDDDVKSVLKANERIVIKNFRIGLDFLAQEDALNDEAIDEYSHSLKENYTALMQAFPNGNYDDWLETINSLNKKVRSEKLKKALEEIKIMVEKTKITEITPENGQQRYPQ
jgi:hypothetical protein